MSVSGPITDRKQLLLDRLADARLRTDDLFTLIRPEALYDRPIPERHRIVFYVGHLEAFDWNLLRETLGLEPFREKLDRLFAFGIDPVDGGLPTDQPSDWPSREEVQEYVNRVRETLDRALAGADLDREDRATRIEVGLEHRLMHAETLAYMFHQLPYDRKHGRRDLPAPRGRTLGHMVRIPAGRVTLGLARGSAFGWDNEFDLHTVDVPEFEIDARSVTNGEFTEFIAAGGYTRRELWDADDWAWRESHGVGHPAFWQREGGGWRLRGMFEAIPLPTDAPAYVSHAEAEAYLRWRDRSLPTEAEFHRAAYGTPGGDERTYPWGDTPPDPSRGNFDFDRWDPVPVAAYPAGDSAFGVADLLGNGWEWTSSPFAPFAGFTAFPFYPGYSANFFDGQHYVIKGGSARTAACMLRRSFRNWFQPRYPYVYAKFRGVMR